MSAVRLTNLAILLTERELADKVDFDYAIQKFAAQKAQKILL